MSVFFETNGIRRVAASKFRLSGLRPRKHRSINEWSRLSRSRYDSLAVLREPSTWLISYYNFIKYTTISPDTGQSWRHHLHPIVKDLDLNQFVQKVCQENLFERNIYSFRHLKRFGHTQFDQSSFVSSGDGEVLVNRLLPFENLDSSLNELFKIKATSPVLEIVNKSTNTKPKKASLSDISQHLIRDHFSRDRDLHDQISKSI